MFLTLARYTSHTLKLYRPMVQKSVPNESAEAAVAWVDGKPNSA